MINYKLFSLAAALPLLIGAEAVGSLVVNVSGIRHSEGALLACVWRDKIGFPTCQKSTTAIRQTLRITGGSMAVRFTGLAPGVYAVSIQHDEDGDGKLRSNFIGMPKEGVGISNTPGGIPSWTRSQLQVSASTSTMITLRYL